MKLDTETELYVPLEIPEIPEIPSLRVILMRVRWLRPTMTTAGHCTRASLEDDEILKIYCSYFIASWDCC